MSAQFVAVSDKAIDLTDIKVTGYDEITEGDVYVQGLTADGKATAIYTYYDVPGELTGWVDSYDELVEPGQVTLEPGEGLWVSAPSSDFGLLTAGQVPTSGISVSLRYGFKLVGNNTPVAVDLTNIDVTGYDEITEGDVYVQGLTADGKATAIYTYYDVPGELTGWVDSYDEIVEPEQVMVEAGEALWVSAPSAAFSLVMPGVTL